ncbi:DUF2752 domain-containing protein [Luteolibacter arcticus]|uniref:DUF2752 domain-containing protein n=1 Tax=Luteolibacter arcticus TaxID=1581411 RepID=A0ABT3GD48_9BACT|nr:DUF2752 domain-containing protein [Luteolibacter arcticus]MCW1921557.1 DUF2752 domain-containing protein [Luteolibacter arcticus]
MQRPWTLLAVAGVAGALLLRVSSSWWSTALPGCLIHEWTGLSCPGCGGTRCAVRLLQGDLAGALTMNAAVVLIAAAGFGVVGRAVWREWKGQPVHGVPPWLAWSLAGLVVVFGLVRNLPWWPFTLLVPS